MALNINLGRKVTRVFNEFLTVYLASVAIKVKTPYCDKYNLKPLVATKLYSDTKCKTSKK